MQIDPRKSVLLFVRIARMIRANSATVHAIVCTLCKLCGGGEFIQRGSSKILKLGNGWNIASRALFRKRERTEFCGKLGEFCEKLGEFAGECLTPPLLTSG